jgi:hypothetical protein
MADWRNRIIERKRMRVGDLAINRYNPKQHPRMQQERLQAVLDKFGIVGDLVAYYSERNQGKLTLFDGHARQGLDPDAEWEVGITDLTDAEVDELVLYFDPLAALARQEADRTAALMADLDVQERALREMLEEQAQSLGFAYGKGNGSGDDETPDQSRQTLAERFVVPPFSVLDARQGYWQERKRAWISLGIQSELGRGSDIVPNGSVRPPEQDGCYQRGYGKRGLARCYGQDLMKGENPNFGKHQAHTAATSQVMDWAGGFDESHRSGTSIFDPVLCELAYRWFCPPGGRVLDPFAGGSVRGIVAAWLGRRYWGIDLRPEQVEANEAQQREIVPDGEISWLVGDSRNLPDLIEGDFDFFFTCPPYFDLEIYSDDGRDLSNAGDYDAFLTVYRDIIAKSIARLKPDRFAAIVVGDIRDKAGFYRNFVSDTIAAFQDAGATLYNEAILVTAIGSLPIRVGKQFEVGRKLGKTHQNVLIFCNGDPGKATEAVGPVEAGSFAPGQVSS